MGKRPFRLGLTGSVGMGKSTTAGFFEELGIPVWDADRVVHDLYETDSRAINGIGKIVPAAVLDGRVDRTRLRQLVAEDPDLLDKIEKFIHPLVDRNRNAFIEQHSDAEVLVFDIPLLFENNLDRWMDASLTVTAPEEVQRERVLERPGMNPEVFETIVFRQMSDAEKRRRADFVLLSDKGFEKAKKDVAELVDKVIELGPHA